VGTLEDELMESQICGSLFGPILAIVTIILVLLTPAERNCIEPMVDVLVNL